MNADISNLRPSWVSKIEVAQVPGVTVAGECWLWRGSTDKASGYGRVRYEGRGDYLHRVTYRLLVGEIPDGFQIDHLCRQRACCAPHHLEPVTPKVNSRRGLRGSRTHCARAQHPLSGDNLYVNSTAKGGPRRICRACRDERLAVFRAARKVRQEQTWAKYCPEAAS